jgi:OHCU decarboxylase
LSTSAVSSWFRSGLSDGLAWFNALSDEEARERLYGCLALRGWAESVAAGRPYESVSQLMAKVDAEMSDLGDGDWLQAFAAHPRIGERGGHSAATSEREQSQVMRAPDETLDALRAENQAYEQRFGHIFLIAAAGRSAGQILDALRERMHNDPATELEVAAEEQRKIARLRILSLLDR